MTPRTHKKDHSTTLKICIDVILLISIFVSIFLLLLIFLPGAILSVTSLLFFGGLVYVSLVTILSAFWGKLPSAAVVPSVHTELTRPFAKHFLLVVFLGFALIATRGFPIVIQIFISGLSIMLWYAIIQKLEN